MPKMNGFELGNEIR